MTDSGAASRTGPSEEPRAPGPVEGGHEENQHALSGPPVVGIGASAGGLDAFKKFFGAMPADSGLAFVLVPHIGARHESLLVKLLSLHTAIPVVEATEGMAVEANRVHVIPPNRYMTIGGGLLHVDGPLDRPGTPTSIDVFLRSLADDQKEGGICIILSGTGAHGAMGLKAVKAAGGLALVQAPETAGQPRMPQCAIATGLADFVLPPEKMPEALVGYARRFFGRAATRPEQAEPPDSLPQVLALLHARTGHDFRCYRKKMVARRVQRRMGLGHFVDLGAYLEHLRTNPEEANRLARDLFISVTSFFRDPEAFHALEAEALAPLVEAKQQGDAIRVWVPGCATGEEAYSLAILLLERMAAARKRCRLQVFATDVDEASLAVARRGAYPESISADVSAERLAQFFTRQGDSDFQANRAVREAVVFAPQDVLGDPPFSRMDLISCRNLLIYLEPEAQQKVLARLHFGLNAGGYLFLGPSETVGRQSHLFEPVNRKWRFYRCVGAGRVPATVLSTPAGVRLPPLERAATGPTQPRGQGYAELTQRLVLEQLGTAAVLTNRDGEALYFLGPTGKYLEFPAGEPTRDVLQMAREGLGPRLRAAIARANRENTTVGLADVPIKRDGESCLAVVTVRPVQGAGLAEGLLLVVFQDEPALAARPQAPAAEAALVQQLEGELRAAREELQGTVEELESSNEELRAANEEAVANNEELQAANEQLEATKEELQSVNDELVSVNGLLQAKVEELESANNDLVNLIQCTDIPTLFLDAGFRIKRYTPAATSLFRLIAADVGRPITDITGDLADDGLLDDARLCLDGLPPPCREVCSEDGRWFERRARPYCTLDGRVAGVVLTFVDVTERKRAADATDRRLAAIVESSADAIFSKGLDGTIQTWNAGAERLYGYAAAEAVGRSIAVTIPDGRAEEWAGVMARLARGEHVEQMESERVRKDGRRVPVVMTYSPIRGPAGEVVSVSAIARDITERKQAHQRLEAIVETAPSLIVVADRHGRIVHFNRACEELTGYAREEVLGQSILGRLVPPAWRPQVERRFADLEAPELRLPHENPWLTKSGAERLIEWRCIALPSQMGDDWFLLGVGVDITERKKFERAVHESEEQKRAILASLSAHIALIDRAGTIVAVNPAWEDFARANGGDPERCGVGANYLDACLNATGPFAEEAAAVLGGLMEVLDGEAAEFSVEYPCHSAAQRRWFLLHATSLRGEGGGVVASHTNITPRVEAELALREREARLRAVLDTAADAIITIDRQGVIQSANKAAQTVFGYSPAELIGQNVKMLMPPPYRDEHDDYLARYLATREARVIGLGREVMGQHKDGTVFPVDLAVTEIGHLQQFTGIVRDISRRRELEREVVEIASLEQRRIGQDLHDTAIQELAGLALMAEALRARGGPGEELAGRISQGLQSCQVQLRAIMRGLLPVPVDSEGLMAALADLAGQANKEGKTSCTFECPEPVALSDNLTATHLYLIAREAVYNSIKHALARNVRVYLEADGRLVLRVRDDGIGMPSTLPEGQGAGLRIMRNRAAIIGAALSIEPASPSGTVITCTLARAPQ